MVAFGESVSINYTTNDGSANAGTDYTGVSGTLLIPAGNIDGTVLVDTTPDATVEPDEDFTLDLSNVGGAGDNSKACLGRSGCLDLANPSTNFRLSVERYRYVRLGRSKHLD